MWKKFSTLFTFLLIFQLISPGFVAPVETKAEGKDSTLTYKGVNTEKTKATFEWSVEGAGEKATVEVPEEYEIDGEQSGDLGDVGSYQTNGNTVTATFHVDEEEGNIEESGEFSINVKLVETSDSKAEENGDEPKAEDKEVEDVDNEKAEETKKDETAEEKDQPSMLEEDEIREAQQISENIIDEIILKREDGSTYEEGDQLDPNEDLELGLEWSLPNDPMYKGGDTFTFQLPEQLAIYSEITGDLDDFGTFVVMEDGEVTFTFNDKINENSNVKGTFWVKTELEKQKITTSTEVLEIVFDEGVAKKITINVKPEGGQAIHKEGQPVDGNFNTDEIQWTVLVNTTKDKLENAIVTDPIGDGQELDVDSIEVQEIEVDLSGNEVEGLGEVTGVSGDSETDELKLNLGDTKKAYKVTFKTKIKDDAKEEGSTTYENTAYLNSDDKGKKQSGASVSVERPESLTKSSSSFDKEDRSVAWEVNANFTEKSLEAGTEIVDKFSFTIGEDDRTDAFEVKDEDIEIKQVDRFTEDGEVDATSDVKKLFDISIGGNKVTYKLKEDTNKAFIIKYKTKAKDGAYIDNDGKISNTVKIDGNTKTSEQHVGQQVGVKTNKGIDYENKTIDWEITINADKQDLRNFVLTDDFSGSGQQLVEDSFDIDPSIDESKITPNSDGEGFEIDFGDITDTYTIKYQTKYTYDFDGKETPNFHNGVDISYESEDGTDYKLEIEDEVDPKENTKNNGVKNGTANNETKEITWTVDVNYNNLTLTDAKVIDKIADNQSLIDGSVKVYETSIDSNGNITTGDDVTENFDVTAEENLVEVLFNIEIDQSHRIEFKTKDKDDIYNSDEVYENTAQFIPRDGEEHNLKANVTLPNQGEFLGKSGFHNKDDWTVDWKIDVNESQSKLNGVTVKDDLGDDGSQILLEDSFKVTKAGSDEELDEEAYELTIDGNAFSIKFLNEITDAYEITYSSYILAEKTADLKNEAEIASEEQIFGSVEKEEEVEVKISTGGGTAEGATAGLTLEKTEKDTDRPLEGVKFTLLTTIGDQEIVVREGTTDEEGKLEWTGLKYGDYTLKEEIPEGYTGKESQEVTIDNDSLEDGVLILKDEIVNERQTGTAKIIKTDAVTGEELSGAAFEITNETTGQKYTLTTEEDGTISEEVPFGKYTVEEITAPDGYRITKEIDNINIKVDETTVLEVKNVAIDEVAGEKTWVDRDGADRPKSITVELFANGKKIDDQKVEADDADDWKYHFTDLDVYDENGEGITYTVKESEAKALDDYKATVKNFDITNELAIGEAVLTKVDSSNDKKTLKGAEFTLEKVISEEETEIIEEKLVTNEEGQIDVEDLTDGDYQFVETKAPSGYRLNSEPYSFTIGGTDQINKAEVLAENTKRPGGGVTPEPEKMDISGIKSWVNDEESDRPDAITVHLLQDGENLQSQKVTLDDNWTYEFNDLPVTNSAGDKYEYTIEEDTVEGYQTKINGYNITNTKTDDPEDPDPEDPTDPEDPGDEDPEEPGDEDPEDPGHKDPEEPGDEDPEDPSDKDPQDPNDKNPEKPDDSDKPDHNNDHDKSPLPGKGNQQDGNKLKKTDISKTDTNKKDGDQLPQTGEDQFTLMIAFGVFLLIAGSIMIFRVTRREQ